MSVEVWDQASGQNHGLQVENQFLILHPQMCCLIACYSAVREGEFFISHSVATVWKLLSKSLGGKSF